MSDFLTSAFGPSSEQIAMVRRWIDERQILWAGESILGRDVHIHMLAHDRDLGVNVSPDDAAVLAEYAASRGHPQAEQLVCAWMRTLL